MGLRVGLINGVSIPLGSKGLIISAPKADSDATQYLSSVAVTNPTTKSAVNTFVTTLKYNLIWDKVVDMGLYLSGDGTIANALKKIKYPGSFSTALNNGTSALVNADYSDQYGVTASATGRKIDTQVIPTDNGLSNTNYCHIVGCTRSITNAAGSLMLDNPVTGPPTVYLGKTTMGMNGGAQVINVPQAFDIPIIEAISSNGNLVAARNFDNLVINPAAQSVTMGTSVSLLGGRSAGAASFTTGSIGFHCIAEYLTYAEIAIIHQAVFTLWEAIGRKSTVKDCLVFGDSITFGINSTSYDKRFSRLLANSHSLVERNAGIQSSQFRQNTATILGGYIRRSDLLKYNILNGGKVYLQYGVNDVLFAASEYNDFRDKLVTLCQELIAFGMAPEDIVIGSISILNNGTSGTDQANYVNAALEAAQTAGVYYADVWQYMTDNGGAATLLSADNVHPNDLGHAAIKDALLLAAAA